MKLTDLRAYVEAKILSKSERNLLQTGTEEGREMKAVSFMIKVLIWSVFTANKCFTKGKLVSFYGKRSVLPTRNWSVLL